MELLRKAASLLFGDGGESENVYRTTVRCLRCGEEIPVRVDLDRELTRTYGPDEGSYYVRKGVAGSGENRCFQTIHVRLTFDDQKQLISREASGGTFMDDQDTAT